MGVCNCNCSMFCCTLLYVHFSIAIILMGKRELIALLNLSSWCLVMVERLFLTVPRGCLQFVIVVFPDHTHLLFLEQLNETSHKCLLSSTDLFQTSCITVLYILTELWAFLDLEIMLKFCGKLAYFFSSADLQVSMNYKYTQGSVVRRRLLSSVNIFFKRLLLLNHLANFDET